MSIKDSQQLKQLQSRKAKLEVEIAEREKEAREAQQGLSRAKNALAQVVSEIESLKERELVVTDHAVLRYMERVMGFDIERIKADMLNEQTASLIKRLGNGKYPIGSGAKIVVKDSAVVSVV